MHFVERFVYFLVDVNECEIEGSCSQICINEKGTYKCECEPGYLRDPQDHTRCKAMEGHASLLFSMQHNIRKISLDHHEMSAIINSTKSATAIDFVFRTGMIFWGDVSEKKIYKYLLYFISLEKKRINRLRSFDIYFFLYKYAQKLNR